ncbi:MAG TPA: cell filamentation protein Fic [Porphyromonadaceae bacterium]|nr:cell filamentation protein Fic [Porphyromonadaceae bacterium]
MKSKLEELVGRYRALGIDQQLDYDKFYLYSIITHSTAIEGSTITELENQIMFDNGIALKGKSLIEQNMNLDLKAAYERALIFARQHSDVTVERLMELSALTMKNTGSVYHTMLGDFSSADGDLRLLNVTAGVGGKSYMSFNKVPTRLTEFCNDLNIKRHISGKMDMQELYDMSFDAHFNLVTIHPWADGNGRMARLMMNWLQFEYGLIPSRIFADDKEGYIKALVDTRESENLNVFRNFMTETMIRHLTNDIAAFEESIGETTVEKVQLSTADRIVSLIKDNPRHSAKSLADAIGISAKGIEKQLAKLKAQGVIRRVGPDKGGIWEVVGTE